MIPAYLPSPPTGVWYLGPVPIRAYALFILAGIAVAAMVSMQGNDPAAPFGAAGRVRPKPPYDFPQAAPRR